MKTPLLTEEHFAQQIQEVRQKLDAMRTSGTFARTPGEKLYFELYQKPEAKGWVAISHGFTESTVKYSEVIWYFVQEGWNVAICDHRGHGKSFRQVQPSWLTHVDRFDDYSDDFACFIKNVIEPRLNGLPLYLIGHSMGGAIAAHVVERFPELPVKKLVLCSPMIAPVTGGIPKGVVTAICRSMILVGRGKACNFAQHGFNGEDDFGTDWCCATSKARHAWYLEIQRSHEEYQNAAATYTWLKESILQTKKVLNRKNTAKVQIPVLLLQAGKDTMVENDREDELVDRLPNARKVTFPEARHEIFRCTDPEVERFMDSILNFLEL